VVVRKRAHKSTSVTRKPYSTLPVDGLVLTYNDSAANALVTSTYTPIPSREVAYAFLYDGTALETGSGDVTTPVVSTTLAGAVLSSGRIGVVHMALIRILMLDAFSMSSRRRVFEQIWAVCKWYVLCKVTLNNCSHARPNSCSVNATQPSLVVASLRFLARD
jgi:hypothetical protein